MAESNDLTLPDSIGARVVFSPDGVHAVVVGEELLYVFDLADRSVVWMQEVTRGPRGLAFSPGGRYLALLEAEGEVAVRARVDTGTDGAVRVRVYDLRAPNPMREFRFAANTLSPARALELAGSLFSVSDDGAYLAVGPERRGEQVDIYALATGARVFHDETADGGFVLSVAFEPGTHRLAAHASSARVWVIDAVGAKFSVVQSFPVAVWPAWTAQGLGFGSNRGLELWTEGAPRLGLESVAAYHLERSPQARGPFTVASLAAPSPRWSFSADGEWLAVWDDVGLRLYRTRDGAQLFEHTGGFVEQARWAPSHFRTLLSAGGYLDLDLTAAKVVRTERFGDAGSGLLSPSGAWFDLQRHGEPHQLLNLE